MTRVMRARVVVALVVPASLLAACGTTPKRAPEPAATRPSPATSAPVASTPSKRGGGYYLDDGPGDSPPPDLDLLPDAIPRVEKYASGANRPYNVFGVDYVPDLSGAPYKQRGVGSWYGRKFHGQRTSNGEIYDMYAMTAAHPTLPIPCYALVTNVQNGRSVIVRVNDRGPFLHNRVMDLSYAAAYKLGYMSSGSGLIEVEMLMPQDIAAGRIPVTTNALVAVTAADRRAPAASAMAAPVAASAANELSIEALIARTAPDRPPLVVTTDPVPSRLAAAPSTVASTATPSGLPPAPVPTAEASTRSLPMQPFPPRRPDADPVAELVASPDRQPAAVLPTTASSAGFYLQLGAFKAKAGAESFAAHVAREIDPALASKVRVADGDGLYRVRVGPYPKRADADVAAAGLRASIAQPVLVMPEGASR